MTRGTSGLVATLMAAGVAVVLVIASPARAAEDVIGDLQTYTTKYEDDLLEVARRFDLGVIELMAANPGVDPWLPGDGVRVTLPTMHVLPEAAKKGIVINTAELRMYYFPPEGGVRTFPLGVGREGYLTPHGQTKIARKAEKPSWYLTPSEIKDHPELPPVIPPGPDNPLGDHALYLGWPTYLIHGTNNAYGIGRRASRGCIRMYPEDIAWLYPKIPVGTPVMVVDQAVKIGRRGNDLYLEAHPSVKQIDLMEETSKSPPPPEPLDVAEWADRILAEAGKDIDRLNWPAIEKALAERPGYPVAITKPGSAQAMTTAPALTAPTLTAPVAAPGVAKLPPTATASPATTSPAPAATAPATATSPATAATPPAARKPLPNLDASWAPRAEPALQPPTLPRAAGPAPASGPPASVPAAGGGGLPPLSAPPARPTPPPASGPTPLGR